MGYYPGYHAEDWGWPVNEVVTLNAAQLIKQWSYLYRGTGSRTTWL